MVSFEFRDTIITTVFRFTVLVRVSSFSSLHYLTVRFFLVIKIIIIVVIIPTVHFFFRLRLDP